jgi:hypothetical protein
MRGALFAGVMFVLGASGLAGCSLGDSSPPDSSPPPSTTSTGAAEGTQFSVPDGWYSRSETVRVGTTNLPVAWASNVAFEPEDDPSDTAPVATLRRLPSDGIVLVAVGPHSAEAEFPPLDSPLKTSDGTFLASQYEGQPAPNVSFGYIDRRVDDGVLNVFYYFGANDPGREMRAQADRVLATLTVE